MVQKAPGVPFSEPPGRHIRERTLSVSACAPGGDRAGAEVTEVGDAACPAESLLRGLRSLVLWSGREGGSPALWGEKPPCFLVVPALDPSLLPWPHQVASVGQRKTFLQPPAPRLFAGPGVAKFCYLRAAGSTSVCVPLSYCPHPINTAKQSQEK